MTQLFWEVKLKIHHYFTCFTGSLLIYLMCNVAICFYGCFFPLSISTILEVIGSKKEKKTMWEVVLSSSSRSPYPLVIPKSILISI